MSNNTTPEQAAELIKECWLEVMPNSSAASRIISITGKTAFVRLYIGAGKHEWFNGYSDNDHLSYLTKVDLESNTLQEELLSIRTKPTKPNMVYGSAKLRKATTKLDHTALVKRFQKVRAFIMENYNLEHEYYKISDK